MELSSTSLFSPLSTESTLHLSSFQLQPQQNGPWQKFSAFVLKEIQVLCEQAKHDRSGEYIRYLVGLDHKFTASCPWEGLTFKVTFIFNSQYGRQEIEGFAYGLLLFSAKVASNIPTPNTYQTSQELANKLQPWADALSENSYFNISNSKKNTNLTSPDVIARRSIVFHHSKPYSADYLAAELAAFAQTAKLASESISSTISTGSNDQVSLAASVPKVKTQSTPKFVNNLGKLAEYVFNPPALPVVDPSAPYKYKVKQLFFNLSLQPGSWWAKQIMVTLCKNREDLKMKFSGAPFNGVQLDWVAYCYSFITWLQNQEKDLNPPGTIQIGPDPIGLGTVLNPNKGNGELLPSMIGTYAPIVVSKVKKSTVEDLTEQFTHFNQSIKNIFFAYGNLG